jgi:tetratricopeptide (TPR) repeat protein
VVPLDQVRADGWFEELAASSPSFGDLCAILGEPFVAFSAIADVRITSVAVDRGRPDASVVDFLVGDADQPHRLPLDEFRRRVAAALLTEAPPPADASAELDAEGLRMLIGAVPLLLAPIFGLKLLELRIGGDAPPSLLMEGGAGRDEVALDQFRTLIRDRIRAEVQRARSPGQGFSLDLDRVDEAERANAAGDWEQTIDLLGGWPGPLSMFMRTPEARQLGADPRATIARGLGLLGTAYAEVGQFDWAEEILRLAIQWSQDGPAAGDLFHRLGETHVSQGREAEAIGLLRRALALGARSAAVLPTLARCYVARGRYVAAAACRDEAVAAGVGPEALKDLEAAFERHLGGGWERFRALVPVRDGASSTVPPPGED